VATRVWDVYSDEQLGAVAFKTPADNWRRAAHKVSDFVYKTLTGEEGYFDTRIVFVHETGPKEDKTKRLMIMDQDGANPIPLTDGLDYQVLTPRFSPTQQQITYMALYDNRPGQVYLFNIETGEQEQLGTFRGMTFAPRFSPDGRQVLMSMERGGNSDVFKMDLSTRQLTRLTENVAIASYLEELRPDPPLMGTSPLERALVLEWNARAEGEGFTAVAEILRNSSKRMENRALPGPIDLAQIPELAERGRRRLTHFFDVLDERLEGREHLIGPAFTFADISAFVVVDFARWVKVTPEQHHCNLTEWFGRLSQRESMEA